MARRGLGMLVALAATLGLLLSPACAETLVQLDGTSSYIEATGFKLAADGIFSVGLWFWPEMISETHEAIVSLATEDLKTSMTVGWYNGSLYYTDAVKTDPVMSEPLAAQTWHYLVLTLEESNQNVFFEPFEVSYAGGERTESRSAHRLGKAYVDGDVVVKFDSRLPDLSNAVLSVGRQWERGHAAKYFTGLVDEVRVYGTALTALQVQTRSFNKPADAVAMADFALDFYLGFDNYPHNEAHKRELELRDSAKGLNTVLHQLTVVNVTVMPYDAIDTTLTVTQAAPLANQYYPSSTTPCQKDVCPDANIGPLVGGMLTIKGSNFANTPFLTIYLERGNAWDETNDTAGEDISGLEPLEFDYVDITTLKVKLPRKALDLTESETDYSIHVLNGGLPLVEDNRVTLSHSATFAYRYQYMLGEDWEDFLTAFYKFDASTSNSVDRGGDGEMDGEIVANYGNGGPFYAPDRNTYQNQALTFVRGERVQLPLLLGAKAEWSLCAWVYADRNARTLFYERDAARTNVANLIQLDEDGVLHLDGEPGAALVFDAWQFVCITKNPTDVTFYVSGVEKTKAAPVSVNATGLAVGLLGTNWIGRVDDVWAFSRALGAYDVMRMYTNEEFAISLDGVRSSLVVTNGAATVGTGAREMDSDAWRSSSFSIEMWVKPTTLSTTQPLFYQPSQTESADLAASSSNLDGVYLSITTTNGINGSIMFFVNQGPTGIGGYYVAPTYTNESAVTAADLDQWMLISVTYNMDYTAVYASATISKNGVALKVNPGTVVDPTYLGQLFARRVAEASTKPIYIGYGKEFEAFEGYFNGAIGEVRLWNKALTQAEVGADCPTMPGADGLYALFKLDEGAGSLFYSGGTPDVQMQFHGARRPHWIESNYTFNSNSDSGYNSRNFFPPTSMVDGEGITNGDLEVENFFTWQARDKCSRLLKFDTEDETPIGYPQVVVTGPLDMHWGFQVPPITSNGDGTFTGKYTSTYCGYYQIRVETVDVPLPGDVVNPSEAVVIDSVTYGTRYPRDGTWADVFNGDWDKEMAMGSPFRAYIRPGPSVPNMSYAYDDPDPLLNNDLKEAWYGVPASFTLQAVDRYGCRRTEGGDSISVTLTGRYEDEGMVDDHGDGTYTISYVPMIESLMQLHVLMNGEHVATNGPPDPKDTSGVSLGTDFTGSPWLIDAKQHNGSMTFSGSDMLETAAGLDHLNVGEELTMEAWVFPMTPYLDGTDADCRMISKESPATGRGYYLGLQGGMVTAGVYIGGTTADDDREDTMMRKVVGATQMAPDAWNHVAAVYNGRTLTVYLNGEADGSRTWYWQKEVKANSQKVRMGFGFSGHMDEVRVSATAKTAEQLMAGMACPMASEDVVMYYMLNDGVGDTAFDYSSYAAPATMVGAPEWAVPNAPYGVNQLNFMVSELTGDGLVAARNGITAPFTMNLKDTCGFDYVITEDVEVKVEVPKTTLFTDGHAELVCPDTKMVPVGEPNIQRNPNIVGVGPVLVTYDPAQCGDALLEITVDGVSPVDSPIPVHVTPAAITSATESTLSGLAASLVSGLDASFTITAHDRFGCKRTSGGDTFAVTLTRTGVANSPVMRGPETSSSQMVPEDNGDGTYTVYYMAPAAGTYVLDVGHNNGTGFAQAQGSPYTLAVTPAPWSKHVTPGASPDARFDPASSVYGDDMYVFRGWDESKAAIADVWKYPLAAKKETWAYRVRVTVANLNSTHEVRVVVDTAALVQGGKMRSDCADVMFLPVDAVPGAAPLGHYMDMHPGCNATETGFWIETLQTGTYEVYMYYGNVYAASSEKAGEDVLYSYDSFEVESIFDAGWQVADTCTVSGDGSATDPTAFTTDDFVAVSGSHSLKVDAMDKRGGAVMKVLSPLSTYVLKGFLYDSDALSAANWISPSFDDCVNPQSTELACPNNLVNAPTAQGLGVFTGTTEARMAMLYPWQAVGPERSCAWKALELVCNGSTTRYYINNELVGERPAQTLDKIFLKGGAPIFLKGGAPPAGDQRFDAIAAWDNVYAARFDPQVEVMVGEEEAVVFTHRVWSRVVTSGTAPPAARMTDASVTYMGKLYMLGGYGTTEDDGKVWYYDFARSRWGSTTPWGSKRLPSRQHQSLSLHGDTIYAFGGRKGAEVFNDVYSYNVGDNAWSEVPATGAAPEARWGHSAVVYKNTLFVFGGFTASGAASAETWGFDLVRQVWMDLTPVTSPAARFSHTAALIEDSLFLYGGSTGTDKLEDSWRYDFDYNLWTRVVPESMAGAGSARSDIALGVYNNTMFMFGGAGTKSTYNDLWSLAVY
jgi:hypothetical protein